jgi:hypothetical protein
MKVVICQPHALAAFTLKEIFLVLWYNILVEADSTPGLECGRKANVNTKFQ